MVDSPTLDDIDRRLGVLEHELTDMAAPHPANGDEIILIMRKVQEARLYVEKAKEKQV